MGLNSVGQATGRYYRALNEVSSDIQKYGFVEDIERALDNYIPFRYNGSV